MGEARWHGEAAVSFGGVDPGHKRGIAERVDRSPLHGVDIETDPSPAVRAGQQVVGHLVDQVVA